MPTGRPAPFARFLRRFAAARGDDGELLRRFAADGDEAAFEALLSRHGPLVWGVCRRLLGDTPDADDAWQATFIVLARKAGTVSRPAALSSWLYGVARRTALKARAIRDRRRAREVALADRPAESGTPACEWADLRAVLDEEIARLPAKHRAAVVLCYLAGRTNVEAARLLRCPPGTVASRLAAARDRLRQRLTRRGLAVSAGLMTAALGETMSPAASLCRGTWWTGRPGSAADLLAEGVLHAMRSARTRLIAVITAVAVMATGFAGSWTLHALPDKPDGPPAVPPAIAPAVAPPAPVVGKGFIVVPITTDLQRHLLRTDARTPALVIVDGSALFADPAKIDPAAVDLNGIKKALAAYHPAADKGVRFTACIGPSKNPHPGGFEMVKFAMIGLGREAGFGRAAFDGSWWNVPFDWDKDAVARLRDQSTATADEPAEGDERVRAYAVKSPLSRFLKYEDVGCIIVLRSQLDLSKADRFPAEVEASAKAAVARLKFPVAVKATVQMNVKYDGDRNNPDLVRAAAHQIADAAGMPLASFQW